MHNNLYGEIYDNAVAALGNPTKAESRAAFVQRVADRIREGMIASPIITPETQAEMLYQREIEPLRIKRRRSLLQVIRSLRDSVLAGTRLKELDPVLDQAFLIGDGTEKPLRYWRVEDYRAVAQVSQKDATDKVAAADVLDAEVESLASCFEDVGAVDTYDLLAGLGDEAAAA